MSSDFVVHWPSNPIPPSLSPSSPTILPKTSFNSLYISTAESPPLYLAVAKFDSLHPMKSNGIGAQGGKARTPGRNDSNYLHSTAANRGSWRKPGERVAVAADGWSSSLPSYGRNERSQETDFESRSWSWFHSFILLCRYTIHPLCGYTFTSSNARGTFLLDDVFYRASFPSFDWRFIQYFDWKINGQGRSKLDTTLSGGDRQRGWGVMSAEGRGWWRCRVAVLLVVDKT